ncbi:transposase [Candidatus Woesebacteria bacterium]|nr:transposase [Candidatus Woesebacteria bacterium]
MPRKYSIKIYVQNGCYHVYNRGVDKRIIFQDEQDYRVFLHLLKYYLSPSNQGLLHPSTDLPQYSIVRPRPLINLAEKVDLLAFCLMPNHFHLLVKQSTRDGMQKLMLKICTTYSMYFNKRNDRVGHLFQGTYKAVLVQDDTYLLHLSRYIHLNPSELTGVTPVSYPYSSYGYYLGRKKADWLNTKEILKYFNKDNLLPFLHKYPSYQRFVEDGNLNSEDKIGTLSLD